MCTSQWLLCACGRELLCSQSCALTCCMLHACLLPPFQQPGLVCNAADGCGPDTERAPAHLCGHHIPSTGMSRYARLLTGLIHAFNHRLHVMAKKGFACHKIKPAVPTFRLGRSPLALLCPAGRPRAALLCHAWAMSECRHCRHITPPAAVTLTTLPPAGLSQASSCF